MKVYQNTRPLSLENVKSFLDENLNALFEKRRQLILEFKNVVNGNALEITNDENYASFLFRIVFKGNEIDVTKSEHYTDDVNAIAIEGILEEFFANDKVNYVSGEN